MGKKKKVTKSPDPVAAVTPVVMVGATWLATKVAETLYRSVTGKKPPSITDAEEKVLNIALWTAGLTAAVTFAEVLVTRLFQTRD